MKPRKKQPQQQEEKLQQDKNQPHSESYGDYLEKESFGPMTDYRYIEKAKERINRKSN